MLNRRQLFKLGAAATTTVPVAAKVATPTVLKTFTTPDTWHIALLDEKEMPLWCSNHPCIRELVIVPSEPGVLDAEDITFNPGPESGHEIHGIELMSDTAFGGIGFRQKLTGPTVANLPFTTDGNPLTIYFDNGPNKVMRLQIPSSPRTDGPAAPRP